jgi:hypothetical protein
MYSAFVEPEQLPLLQPPRMTVCNLLQFPCAGWQLTKVTQRKDSCRAIKTDPRRASQIGSQNVHNRIGTFALLAATWATAYVPQWNVLGELGDQDRVHPSMTHRRRGRAWRMAARGHGTALPIALPASQPPQN